MGCRWSEVQILSPRPLITNRNSGFRLKLKARFFVSCKPQQCVHKARAECTCSVAHVPYAKHSPTERLTSPPACSRSIEIAQRAPQLGQTRNVATIVRGNELISQRTHQPQLDQIPNHRRS